MGQSSLRVGWPAVGGSVVEARLRARGRVTFAEFMAIALYDREGGYYVRYGAGRDYRSAPQTSPAFGHVIGAALARMWEALGRPARFDVVELGAGEGRLAEQVVAYLRAREPAVSEALRYLAMDVG